jgi:hypothetical protein
MYEDQEELECDRGHCRLGQLKTAIKLLKQIEDYVGSIAICSCEDATTEDIKEDKLFIKKFKAEVETFLKEVE